MPVNKKTDVTTPPVGGAKLRKPAAKKAAPAQPKPSAQKKAANPATAAATHKAPARRSSAKRAGAPVFDVELHRAEIEREAYLIWTSRGRSHGHHHEDWLTAIEIVKARHLG